MRLLTAAFLAAFLLTAIALAQAVHPKGGPSPDEIATAMVAKYPSISVLVFRGKDADTFMADFAKIPMTAAPLNADQVLVSVAPDATDDVAVLFKGGCVAADSKVPHSIIPPLFGEAR